MEYNTFNRNNDFEHPMDNAYKFENQNKSCSKCNNSQPKILKNNQKTCKKCNEAFNIFSWWGALGCYAFYCIVKESIDLVKFIVTLF
jgi:protein-arginine kinase activator protein McsA